MTTKTFRVRIFDVDESDQDERARQQAFAEAIENARDLSENNRLLVVKNKRYRLDNYDMVDGCHLMNFAIPSYPGPGRMQINSPVTSFDLGENESFGYETAMLYDPDHRLAFVEVGRPGMGAGAIAGYFGKCAAPEAIYYLVPRLIPDAATRARRKRYIHKVIVRVSGGRARREDRRAGMGLIQALRSSFTAQDIKIEVSLGRQRRGGLRIEPIRELINRFLEEGDASGITKFEVVGKEHEDETAEVVDLLRQQETRELELDIDQGQRKVLHRVRWSALATMRRDFLN